MRLLILQQERGPLNVVNTGGPTPGAGESQDFLSTQAFVLRGFLVVERAIASSGLKHLPSIDTVIGRLVVTRPDPTARILQLSYNAATRDEAFQMVRAVVDSYGEFLRSENWENSNGAITMIIKARNELNEELKQLEREYLEFHRKNPAYATDERGRTLIARRLEQWDQVANQVQLRSLQFQSQLELGRNLVSGGAELGIVTNALDRLNGIGGDVRADPLRLSQGNASAISTEQLNEELIRVEFERLTAERVLQQLRSAAVTELASVRSGPSEMAQDDSETARLLAEAQSELNHARRTARNPGDTAAINAQRRVKELQAGLSRRQSPARQQAIVQAETDLITLKAKSASLRERLERVKSEHLSSLRQEEAELTRDQGPQDEKVLQIRRQVRGLRRRWMRRTGTLEGARPAHCWDRSSKALRPSGGSDRRSRGGSRRIWPPRRRSSLTCSPKRTCAIIWSGIGFSSTRWWTS